MSVNKAEELVNKYVEGTCSDSERALVESWHLRDIQENKTLVSSETVQEVQKRMRVKILMHSSEASLNNEVVRMSETKRVLRWSRLVAAAVVLLVCSLTAYLYFDQSKSPKSVVLADTKETKDIQAVDNKAILTLEDGSLVELGENQKGIVMNADSISYEDGVRVYANSSVLKRIEGALKTQLFTTGPLLTLSTPKGSQYHVTFSDGTKIWLNSQSSVRYPRSFEKNFREIEVLRGEVYLEVAHNPKAPFVVNVNGQEIEVLGTSFNINAYSPTNTITTLVNGLVKINSLKTKDNLVLNPGEEAISDGDRMFKREANLNAVTAWKENFFYFKNESIENVLKQVTQWYGVSIKYTSSLEKLRIGGFISRTNSLKELLELLEEVGDFSLELKDNTVIVADHK
ncbi:FecR family protein [Sphingobacterium lumbrici]|uniref:FecR family protein n=1 Tax=Sphingobacterium lumbrici TaxID=2559600 RepID=UPI0011286D6B|nr:FecR family protein [Sphingobacterium lumbrici]